MKGNCSKCSKPLESSWQFCPYCGTACAHQAAETTHHHLAREKAPVKGAFSGLFFGLIAAPIMVIAGSMICLTGLGIFLGIPLIVAGVCAPLIGSVVGLNPLKAECPWCGAKISGVGIFNRFSCPTCSKRIEVRKRELIRAE